MHGALRSGTALPNTDTPNWRQREVSSHCFAVVAPGNPVDEVFISDVLRDAGCFTGIAPGNVQAERPNVILITVHDLNDCIEPLGGHPNAKTPDILVTSTTGTQL